MAEPVPETLDQTLEPPFADITRHRAPMAISDALALLGVWIEVSTPHGPRWTCA